jgi:hypothetical protein
MSVSVVFVTGLRPNTESVRHPFSPGFVVKPNYCSLFHVRPYGISTKLPKKERIVSCIAKDLLIGKMPFVADRPRLDRPTKMRRSETRA